MLQAGWLLLILIAQAPECFLDNDLCAVAGKGDLHAGSLNDGHGHEASQEAPPARECTGACRLLHDDGEGLADPPSTGDERPQIDGLIERVDSTDAMQLGGVFELTERP